jgi:hypothetical protein
VVQGSGHACFLALVLKSWTKCAAGRAGRRNSVYGKGLVTCLNSEDIPRLQEALATPLEALSTPRAGLFPEFEQLEAFAGNQLEDDFYNILTRSVSYCHGAFADCISVSPQLCCLELLPIRRFLPALHYRWMLLRFAADAQMDGTYMFCKQESILQAARFLSKVDGLSLQVSNIGMGMLAWHPHEHPACCLWNTLITGCRLERPLHLIGAAPLCVCRSASGSAWRPQT